MKANLNIPESTKEELVEEVLTRINEMSEVDKKKRAIANRKIMSDMTRYFEEKRSDFSSKHPYKSTGESVSGPHLWHAYFELRKLVPWIVGVRYSNTDNWNAFYEANPDAERREGHDTIANAMLEEDKELADAIGRELIDILFKYLEPDGWKEVRHRNPKYEKPARRR